ncbi:DUF2231 domain-containing protein [Methylomarinum sp. Ch1-1]|uniref:DUF2231 domain-containing protein n=1 Tax=Methylomarinum roseum TaxID=3067653 RepID=A0AAU7NPX8_9GAMM|nr:DUF2231 domain-containing protein [Methylomarinum sp. Ch1-1]MDP4521048.1 DUF2231 domain-containing protein [Methylomarinum sp. Ch1-1]
MFNVNNYLSFAIHGGQGGHGGGVAGAVQQLLAFLETLTTQSPGEIFSSIMPGIAAMENIHPLLVHFPIAFLSAFILVDFAGSLAGKASWRQAAGWFLYLGTLTAALTVAAGLAAAASVSHGDNVHAIMERHQYMGISILLLASLLSLWRLLSRGVIQGGANVLYLLLVAVLGGLVVLTADLGGLMVYKYGVAVETSEPSMLDYFQQHQHSH